MIVLALMGWVRGALRLAGAFLALLLSGILAGPLNFLTQPLVRGFGVHELLVPIASTFATGFVLFLVFLVGLSMLVKKHWGDELPQWDKPVGSVLGAVWGLCLVLLLFTGLNTTARADRAMREAAAETALRVQARSRIEGKVEVELEPLSYQLAPEEYQRQKTVLVTQKMREYRPSPEQIREVTEPGPLDPFLEDLRSSPFGGAVESFSPLDAKGEKVLRDLTVVVGDAVLMERFQRQPKVAELVKEPAFQALSNNEDIASAIREKRFRALLDHPRIVAAARDPKLRQKLTEVDIEGILAEVKGP